MNNIQEFYCQYVQLNEADDFNKKGGVLKKVYNNGIGSISPLLKIARTGAIVGALAGIGKMAMTALNNPMFVYKSKLFYRVFQADRETASLVGERVLSNKEYIDGYWKLIKETLPKEELVQGSLIALIVMGVTILSLVVAKGIKNRGKEIENKVSKGSDKLKPEQKSILKKVLSINTKLINKFKL